MISASKLKYYSSLLQKKHRDEENKFIAEGLKIVEEGLNSSFNCEILFIRKEYSEFDRPLQDIISQKRIEVAVLSEKDFDRISDSKTPQGISGVFVKPEHPSPDKIKSGTVVCLDKISDPGNVGTIMRNCDWFGITDILIGKENADLFNPKTVRSSMGSIFHLNLFFTSELQQSLSDLKKRSYKVITADMSGTSLFDFQFPGKSVMVFSSEAHGVSPEIKEISDAIITVPGFGKAESLNVASASAVILSRYAEKKL